MKKYFKALYKKWQQKRNDDLLFSKTLCEITKPTDCEEVKITKWESFWNLFRRGSKSRLFKQVDYDTNFTDYYYKNCMLIDSPYQAINSKIEQDILKKRGSYIIDLFDLK